MTDYVSYVINAKAQKEMYKTMAKNKNALKEPKDLSREWHNDGEPTPRRCPLLTNAHSLF